MTSFLGTIISVVIMIVGLILTFLGVKNVNLSKSKRGYQFIMPLVAGIYCLLIMPFLGVLADMAMGLVSLIGSFLNWLSGLSFVPVGASNSLMNAGMGVQNWVMNGDTFSSFIVINILIMFVFIFVKKIVLGIFGGIAMRDPYAFDKIRSLCYEYNGDEDEWFLKEELVHSKELLKALFYFTVIFVSVALVASMILYNYDLINAYFFPVFCVILVGELFFYLDGLSLSEYKNEDPALAEREETDGNFDEIRRLLKKLFGDKLMADDKDTSESVAEDTTLEEIIRQFENDEDPIVNNLSEYIKRVGSEGVFDTNYLFSMKDLLDGKSILFNNPFYRDLIPYAFYPMNRKLLAHKKVLVVLGRHAVEEDVIKWLEDGIEEVTGLPFLWKIGVLDKATQDVDIGIITRSDVHDIEIHQANELFLADVEYVVLLEPSKMISTAQIGLNLLVKKIKTSEDKQITYCLCDKNCDGLVDAMSHILMTNLTEVSATKKHEGSSIFMCWEAGDDYLHHRIVPNIARYLGTGTELSFVALKNGVPRAKWLGGDAFPVTDIKWIAKQYYHELMNYAELPPNQDSMNDHFDTTSNLWAVEAEEKAYLTVEDESFNMFEMYRDFSTRAGEEGFVNVISPDYMLKDYMADNAGIFKTDAKAIPNIVADYVRSDRNVTLRLLLMMSTYPVDEDTVRNEMSLLGIGIFDLKKQLWYEIYKCYASVDEIAQLSDDYEEAVMEASQRTIAGNFHEFSSEILVESEKYNYYKGHDEKVYSITDKGFLQSCSAALRSAAFIAEDEQGEKNYLGSELYDHVYSKYLPGQFFTFGGKYYEMQYLTADGQVLIRRAADHIKGRPCYRQIRDYTVSGIKPSEVIGATRVVDGIRVSRQYADVSVSTSGYYRMARYSDFDTARKVTFDKDENGIPDKEYRNKEVLVIDLPDNGGLTDEVRYTITLMLNETFKSLFAENQPFISAVTDCSFLGEDFDGKPMTYTLNPESCDKTPGRIYIFEDSQLDLGLINAVDRNLHRIFEIICDYLGWHYEVMDRPEEFVETTEGPDIVFDFSEFDKKDKKGVKSILDKIKDGIKGIFGGKKKGRDLDNPDPADLPDVPELDEPDPYETKVPETYEPVGEETAFAPEAEAPEEAEVVEETEAADEAEVVEEPKFNAFANASYDEPIHEIEFEGDDAKKIKAASGKKSKPGIRLPYKDRHFMLFGYEKEPAGINLEKTLDYLKENGFENNSLKQARDSVDMADIMGSDYIPYKRGSIYCDFCGAEITGQEYDKLKDGRLRCKECSKTTIKSLEEFENLFNEVKRNMERFYGIKYDKDIKIEMVNAKKLHKKVGQTFVPTDGHDGRVLGVAIKDMFGRLTLVVENGAPRMASVLTMAHEMTHIWQYINWDDKGVRMKYEELELQVYEGMAEWAKVQYAYLIDEPEVARREELMGVFRPDEYGHGLLRYIANYPLSEGTKLEGTTPFKTKIAPLSKACCEAEIPFEMLEHYKRELMNLPDEKPAEEAAPDAPEVTVEPEVPVAPAEPETPAAAVEPEVPETPVEPETPEPPAEPETIIKDSEEKDEE